MTKQEKRRWPLSYLEEAEALADILLPIPPRVCLDNDGKVVKTDRCLQCPMKIPCELREE